jgi:hypothetical protein
VWSVIYYGYVQHQCKFWYETQTNLHYFVPRTFNKNRKKFNLSWTCCIWLYLLSGKKLLGSKPLFSETRIQIFNSRFIRKYKFLSKIFSLYVRAQRKTKCEWNLPLAICLTLSMYSVRLLVTKITRLCWFCSLSITSCLKIKEKGLKQHTQL